MHEDLKLLYLDYGRALLGRLAESSTDVLAPIFDGEEEAAEPEVKED